MFVCPVTFSAAVAAGPLHHATLEEQSHLELQFDGPIPARALMDLRRNPPRPFAAAVLMDDELAQWQTLAWRNLKALQRQLYETRHSNCRMRAQWCLRQCRAARAEWRVFAMETARRRRALRL